ncbi:transcription termination factor MTERF15, mitochondrial-like isoform X2 [Carex rostrata]
MSSHLLLKRAIYSSFFSPPQCHYHRLLSSPLSTQTQPKELPFIADYLISSFSFSLHRALKASANRNLTAIKSLARPEAVVKFLTDTGLSHAQIKSVVSLKPDLLGYDADKTLRPKAREIMEKGIPGEVLVQMIRYNPAVLQLKDTLSRLLFWRDFVGNNDKALLKIISRNNFLFNLRIDKHILYRLNLLKEYGLSKGDVVSLLERRSCWGRNLVSLRQILDLIEELGIPRGSRMFLWSLKAIGNYSKSKIKSNEEFFKNTYGWSQEEFCAAFRKYPVVLQLSEENVRSTMNFLMSKAGFEARSIALLPRILGCSLEKVLIPRYTVLSALESKGLKKKCSFFSACLASERRFREIYVVPYEKDVPGLGEAYAAAYGGKVPV